MALGDLPRADLFIHSDTTFEREATYTFAEQWTPWLGEHGITVQTVQSDSPGRWLDSKAVFIPAFTKSPDGSLGQQRRQCTHRWKIVPIRKLVRDEMKDLGINVAPGVVEMMTGITTDEWQRMRDSDVAYIKNTYPLIDRGISRSECVAWLESHDLPVPVKSACTFCPYQSNIKWQQSKQAGGKDWAQAVDIDIAIRHRRPEFELSVHSARLPLTEAVEIPEDYGATQPTFEACESGFCWT